MSSDVGELRALARDLGAAPDRVQRGLRPIVSKGALNIKTDLQRDMRESAHFRQIAPSISYDITVSGDGIEAQIGPDKSRAGGALANIAYFGSSTGGGATVPDPIEALAVEAERLDRALGDLLGDAL